MAATTQVGFLVWTFSYTLSFGVAVVGADFHPACTHPACTPSKRTGICTNSRKCGKTAIESWPVIWVHSSVVRAADCRSAGPWFKSGCALACLLYNWRPAGMSRRMLSPPDMRPHGDAFATSFFEAAPQDERVLALIVGLFWHMPCCSPDRPCS